MAKRKTPVDRETLMRRTRAARAYCNQCSGYQQEAYEMAAFLELFHPELPEESKRELIRDQKAKAKS